MYLNHLRSMSYAAPWVPGREKFDSIKEQNDALRAVLPDYFLVYRNHPSGKPVIEVWHHFGLNQARPVHMGWVDEAGVPKPFSKALIDEVAKTDKTRFTDADREQDAIEKAAQSAKRVKKREDEVFKKRGEEYADVEDMKKRDPVSFSVSKSLKHTDE